MVETRHFFFSERLSRGLSALINESFHLGEAILLFFAVLSLQLPIGTLLATAINLAAVGTFIVARAVLWPQCVSMIAGALTGGWFGARYGQKVDPQKMRYLVIGVGW